MDMGPFREGVLCALGPVRAFYRIVFIILGNLWTCIMHGVFIID